MKKNHEILDEVMGTLKSTPDLTDSQYHYVKLAMDEFAQQQSDYWKKRCEAAEKFIKYSPCDPDITGRQIDAHKIWQELKNQNL